MQNLLRASAQWFVLESAVVWLISSPMYVKSLIGAFLCSFVHHSKSGKGFSLSFSQFYHSWLPQIWGTVVFVGYLTVGFVLGSTTYISPGRIIYVLASQFSGAGEGFSFKVATSKLPKIGKMHIHNCFSCSSIFLCFSQWNCSPNSCRFDPFLMHFHFRLGKRKLFWSPAKTDVLFRLWAGQSLRFQGKDFPRANFIFLMQLSAPFSPTL